MGSQRVGHDWVTFTSLKAEDMGEKLAPGRPHGSCLITIPLFSSILLNLEENRCWTRKRNYFWIKSLIINSTEELDFRGTWFQSPILSHPSPNLSENEAITTRAISCWNGTCVCVQSCPVICSSMDSNPLGSSVHGVLQTRILKWVAVSFSRESSWPRNQTQMWSNSHISCTGR